MSFKTRNELKHIVYEIMKADSSKAFTKDDIKNKVYDYLKSENLLTREFVNAFGDIGWSLQALKHNGLVTSTKSGKHWYWEVKE